MSSVVNLELLWYFYAVNAYVSSHWKKVLSKDVNVKIQVQMFPNLDVNVLEIMPFPLQ